MMHPVHCARCPRDGTWVRDCFHQKATILFVSGKIVVAPPALKLESAAMTGGMGGVGMHCARALAPLTRQLVVAGRSARNADMAPLLSAASVRAMQLDVGFAADMQALHSAQPRAVLHASGTLADGLIRNQRAGQVRRVWASKAPTACLRALHDMVTDIPGHCSVLFSSVAVPIAAAGQVRIATLSVPQNTRQQANYVAANSMLDAHASATQHAGGNAVSVQWGAWESEGAYTLLLRRSIHRHRDGERDSAAATRGDRSRHAVSLHRARCAPCSAHGSVASCSVGGQPV